MDEMTRTQRSGPAFWHRVYGNTPAELEQAALEVAAEFFGPDAALEVDRRWDARRSVPEDDTDQAYAATIYVRLMEPVAEDEKAAERIRRELEDLAR